MKRRQKKQFKRNKKRVYAFVGPYRLPAFGIMVSPADSELIAGGSDERRRFMDVVISQYDKEYLTLLIRYNKSFGAAEYLH